MKLRKSIEFTVGSGLILVGLSLADVSQAASVTLTGTIRDFKYRDTEGGHPDFEHIVTGLDVGIVQSNLGNDGKPVYAGSPNTPSTTGQANFDQWYRNVAGVNQSTLYSIVLDDADDDGIYTYASNAFFPIDNQLFGNQSASHNYSFTYELNSKFTYQSGQEFTFTGDDDIWVFINGKLAIDLGGVHEALSQTIDLDAAASSLGITLGNEYSLDIFFAERHTRDSNFRIDTSILLEPDDGGGEKTPEPASLIGLLGIGLLGSIVKKKKIQA